MNLDYFRVNFSRKRPNLLLKLLLVIDLLFILGHLYALYTDSSELRSFMVDADKGYPEIFQYLKFLSIAGISAYLMFFQKRIYYFSWGCVFFLLFLDDAFQLHEKIGKVIAYWFEIQPMMGLKPRDIGELAYMACVGTGVLIVMWFAYANASKKFRDTCWDIGILLGLFLFFAGGVDMLHSIMEKRAFVGNLLALFEDGGEMLVISLITWYFYFIVSSPAGERAFLFQYFNHTPKSFFPPKRS